MFPPRTPFYLRTYHNQLVAASADGYTTRSRRILLTPPPPEERAAFVDVERRAACFLAEHSALSQASRVSTGANVYLKNTSLVNRNRKS